MHCQSGVTKGIKKGGNPIEVMGMLMGRPDPITPRTLVVTDAFPLPIEGFETRVVADDSDVINHMIAQPKCHAAAMRSLPAGHGFTVPDNLFAKITDEDRTDWQTRFSGVRS